MDEVDITLEVVQVGRSSVRYALEIADDDRLAASGSVVTVYLTRGADHAQPWPDHVGRALREGGRCEST
jgi:acyl-CoA thioester hydrolase